MDSKQRFIKSSSELVYCQNLFKSWNYVKLFNDLLKR